MNEVETDNIIDDGHPPRKRRKQSKPRRRTATIASSLPPAPPQSFPERISQETPLIDVREFRQNWQHCLAREKEMIDSKKPRTMINSESVMERLLDAEDLKIPTAYDTIEEDLAREIRRTMEQDKLFDGTPRKLKKMTRIESLHNVKSGN